MLITYAFIVHVEAVLSFIAACELGENSCFHSATHNLTQFQTVLRLGALDLHMVFIIVEQRVWLLSQMLSSLSTDELH